MEAPGDRPGHSPLNPALLTDEHFESLLKISSSVFELVTV
jgi:hypothetical protein